MAVAEFRETLDADGIYDAYSDLCNFYADHAKQPMPAFYTDGLNEHPRRLSRLFMKYADSCEA